MIFEFVKVYENLKEGKKITPVCVDSDEEEVLSRIEPVVDSIKDYDFSTGCKGMHHPN